MAEEWNCKTAKTGKYSGKYSLSTNCIMNDHIEVEVSSQLEITGTIVDMDKLLTMTAASGKRHFLVGGAKLTLRYIKLEGQHDRGGGGIYAIGSSINLHYLVFSNNKANYGGAINIVDKSNVEFRQCSFLSNEAQLGNDIYTNYHAEDGEPTISLVNAYFDNPTDNDIWEGDKITSTWRSCSSDPCTEKPFQSTAEGIFESNGTAPRHVFIIDVLLVISNGAVIVFAFYSIVLPYIYTLGAGKAKNGTTGQQSEKESKEKKEKSTQTVKKSHTPKVSNKRQGEEVVKKVEEMLKNRIEDDRKVNAQMLKEQAKSKDLLQAKVKKRKDGKKNPKVASRKQGKDKRKNTKVIPEGKNDNKDVIYV
eukprot:g6844.t1